MSELTQVIRSMMESAKERATTSDDILLSPDVFADFQRSRSALPTAPVGTSQGDENGEGESKDSVPEGKGNSAGQVQDEAFSHSNPTSLPRSDSFSPGDPGDGKQVSAKVFTPESTANQPQATGDVLPGNLHRPEDPGFRPEAVEEKASATDPPIPQAGNPEVQSELFQPEQSEPPAPQGSPPEVPSSERVQSVAFSPDTDPEQTPRPPALEIEPPETATASEGFSPEPPELPPTSPGWSPEQITEPYSADPFSDVRPRQDQHDFSFDTAISEAEQNINRHVMASLQSQMTTIGENIIGHVDQQLSDFMELVDRRFMT